MKVGIALSGGLSKGAYQYGFIEALLKYIPYEDIKCVSSSSIGLINAYGLCANKMDKVKDIWENVDFESIWQLISSCWNKHYIRRVLTDLVSPEDNINIPFYTTMTYVPFMGRYYYIDKNYQKKLIKFFRAAIGFPVVTGWPKFYKGWLTMDGGAFDNIPIYPLIEKEDLDLIICIHFDSHYRQKKKWQEKNTIIIDLDASLGNNLRSQSFNFSHDVLKRMLEAGYEYGVKFCEKLFKNGYDNFEGVKEMAKEIHEEEFEERMKAGTIDRLVTTLNGVSQVFRKPRCIKKLVKDKKKKVKKNE